MDNLEEQSTTPQLTKINVPWWSWPAIAASLFDFGMASNVASDAKFLKRLPQGQLIPIAVILIAAIFGLLTPGYRFVYTESLPFLLLALATGLMFPSLGVLLVLSFSVFDLLIFLPKFSFGGLGGHLVSYWLLWLLVVEIPGIFTDFANSVRRGQEKLSVNFALVGALLAGVIVYIWTLGEPLLIRPFFTWAGTDPSVEAVYTVQVLGFILAIVGAVVALVAGLTKTFPQIVTTSQVRDNPIQLITRYVLPVAFVGGVISNFFDLALLIGGVLLARFVGQQVAGMQFYEQSIGRIPKAYRFVLAFIVTLVFSLVIMQLLYKVDAISEFFPHVLVIAAGFCIFEFFIGEPPTKKLSTPVGVTALVLFLMLAASGVAYADNCGGRTDCNGTAKGAAAAAAGAGAIAGLGRRNRGGKGGDKGGDREKDALDKAREATDWLSKAPGPHPFPKQMAKGLLDRIYDTARQISDAMRGWTGG